MKNKLTKIVATLGPASDSPETIEQLLKSGVNVFRFNTKHNTAEWHEERVQRVQKIADKLEKPIGIMLDLQGPELRIQTLEKKSIKVKKGDIVKIALSPEDERAKISLPQPAAFESLKQKDTVLIDDGYIEGAIEKVTDDLIHLKILNSGEIRHKKGVNLPGKYIDLPSLIEADLKQLDMASRNEIDFVALSFVRSKEDIQVLRDEMHKRELRGHIVAKIESKPALENLQEIIDEADAVMVARGDLGIEVPIEELVYWQKEIIKRCRLAKKPVITATEMLESMIKNPRPTRAEATDVANAVLDGTDAVMLSAETAAGKYPVRSVDFMASIAKFNESKQELQCQIDQITTKSTTDQIVNAAVTSIENQSEHKLDYVIVFTETGNTARTLSRHRLKIPVIAVTDRQKTVETLTLSFGIIPKYCKFPRGAIESPVKMLEKLVKKGIIKKEKHVLVIHGKHWRTPGLTNSLSLHKT